MNAVKESHPASTDKSPWAIVVNPRAGGGKAVLQLPKLLKELDHLDVPHEIFTTESKGHATVIAEDLCRKGYLKIAGFGGDGTHHEVVNGIWRADPTLSRIVFAALSGGSGNDWAKSKGIPRNPPALARMLQVSCTESQGLGVVSYRDANGDARQRAFINMVGSAYDAEVVRGIENGNLKKKSSFIYLAEGLRRLVQYRPKTVEILCDEKHLKGEVFTFHAGLGMTAGGGMRFLPHADPGSDKLACSFLPASSIVRILSSIHLLYNGKIGRFKGAELWMSASVVVGADSSMLVEADGEFLGSAPFDVKLLPNVLNFVTVNKRASGSI